MKPGSSLSSSSLLDPCVSLPTLVLGDILLQLLLSRMQVKFFSPLSLSLCSLKK